MTAADWHASTDPEAMLQAVLSHASRRKLRFFAAAWFRQPEIWRAIEPCARHAIETAERHADGLAEEAELQQAINAIRTHFREQGQEPVPVGDDPYLADQITVVPSSALTGIAMGWPQQRLGFVLRIGYEIGLSTIPRDNRVMTALVERLQYAAANLLRDVFGGRYADVPDSLDFVSPAVVELAQAVYGSVQSPNAHLSFSRLAVLADALEEAGCTISGLLAHLRSQDDPHVRGCWALDFILAKE